MREGRLATAVGVAPLQPVIDERRCAAVQYHLVDEAARERWSALYTERLVAMSAQCRLRMHIQMYAGQKVRRK